MWAELAVLLGVLALGQSSPGPDLLLVGGRPRGTLYAVYAFLEETVGVRWLRVGRGQI